MNTAEEQRTYVANDESGMIHIPVVELVSAFVQQRRWLATMTVLGMLISLGVAFLIPLEYRSTAELLPPDQRSITGTSVLSGLNGMDSLLSGGAGGGGGLLSTRTPGQTVIGMLSSRTVQENIINRFNLLQVYHCKFYEDARKILSTRTLMEEDKKSGIVSISVDDHDRYRSRDMATAYVEELNRLLTQENTSSAHLERVFLDERLKSLKVDLDATSNRLSQFSSKNATLNPQSQGATLIEAAAKLQGELITAQSELYGLKAQYSDDNVRVRAVRARIDELQSQLRKMSGVGEKEGGSELGPNQLYPSIRELPILGAAYSEIYRRMVMQEGIYETLTKESELAKVQEAKEIPTIKVLDMPGLPERKNSPHRSVIVATGTLLSAFLAVVWVIMSTLWKLADPDGALKQFVSSILRMIRVGRSMDAI